MLIFLLCAAVVFGLPLVLATSARLVVTGSSEFRARVLETVAAAVRRGVAVEPQFLWLMAHDVRGRRRLAVRRAAQDLDAGRSLAQSLAGALKLPAGDVAAIAAAEGTPHLEATLRETARADRRRWQFRHALLIRLAYPALILAFLGGFLGIGIAPKFREVCASMDVSIGQFMHTFDAARVIGLSLAALTVVVLLCGLRVVRTRLPLLAGLRATASAERVGAWLHALSSAVRAGRPLDEALDRTAPAIGHPRHVRDVHVVAERVRQGTDVVSAWALLPVPDWLRARAPLLAGPTEVVASALGELAEMAADRSRLHRERVLLVLQPVLLGITGLTIGAVFYELFAMLHRLREMTLW